MKEDSDKVGPLDLIHGVRAIAKLLNMSERTTYDLLIHDQLPFAVKTGFRWSCSRKAAMEYYRLKQEAS